VQWTTIGRTCGELGVSRALGDPDFKGFGPNSHAAPPAELFFPWPDGIERTITADLVLAVRQQTKKQRAQHTHTQLPPPLHTVTTAAAHTHNAST